MFKIIRPLLQNLIKILKQLWNVSSFKIKKPLLHLKMFMAIIQTDNKENKPANKSQNIFKLKFIKKAYLNFFQQLFLR